MSPFSIDTICNLGFLDECLTSYVAIVHIQCQWRANHIPYKTCPMSNDDPIKSVLWKDTMPHQMVMTFPNNATPCGQVGIISWDTLPHPPTFLQHIILEKSPDISPETHGIKSSERDIYDRPVANFCTICESFMTWAHFGAAEGFLETISWQVWHVILVRQNWCFIKHKPY